MFNKQQSCCEFAEGLSKSINLNNSKDFKKEKGQFFTSPFVAKIMADMVVFKEGSLKVLDPGSGTGILIAAIVDRIISNKLKINLEVDVFESDETIIPYLIDTLKFCARKMNKEGNFLKFNVIVEDYIIYHKSLIEEESYNQKYDCIISNPPYFKINKNHIYAQIMKEYLSGQPNVYFMFIIMSIKLLKENGQMIFITPRSYCSGKYFEAFREFLINEIKPCHFHLFDSRDRVFFGENIKQEVLITNGFKRKENTGNIKISKTYKKEIENEEYLFIPFEEIIDSESNFNLIHLPTTIEEYNILKISKRWENKLIDYNLKVSTGQVVKFRNKNEIINYDSQLSYPLIHATHIREGVFCFPITKQDLGIKKDTKKKSILLEPLNYILLKRISSLEQKKRIICASFIGKHYSFEKICLEDHVNYIFREQDSLKEEESIGLTAFLNSKLVDEIFRISNGNTQLNAYDLQNMRLPPHAMIIKLGEKIMKSELLPSEIDDYLVGELVNKGGL